MGTLNGGPNLVTDGLILYMDPGNVRSYIGTGSNSLDISLLRNNAILQGSMSYSTSPSRFDTNVLDAADTNLGQLQINTQISFSDASEYTLGYILKMRSGAQAQISCLAGNSGTNPFICVRPLDTIGATWQIWFRQAVSAVYATSVTISDYNIQNNWFDLALVLKADRRCYVYVNGVAKTSFAITNTQFYFNWVLGGYLSSGFRYCFQGSAGNIKVYNRALTDAEVLQNYIALKGRFGL